MIKASVIVPMYNSEKYVDRCLSCITNQTVREIEIVIVVTEGVDLTVERCMEWQNGDDRIAVYVIQEKGLGYARNYALEIAKGEYISFVDADDIIEPDFLEKMIAPLRHNSDIDIACCGFDRRLQSGSVEAGWLPLKTGETDVDFAEYRRLISFGTVWLKVYRRAFLVTNNLYQYRGCHEDDAMHLMLAAVVKKVFFIQEVLYHYENDNLQSLLHNRENDLQYYDAIEFAVNYLMERELFSTVRRDIYHIIRHRTKCYMEETGDERFSKKADRLLQNYFSKDLLLEKVREENEKLSFSEEIVIYGFGADGQAFWRDINKSEVRAVIDNNPANKGRVIEEIPIYTLEEFVARNMIADIVICSSKYYYEIEEQLYDKGMRNYYSVDEYKAKWKKKLEETEGRNRV